MCRCVSAYVCALKRSFLLLCQLVIAEHLMRPWFPESIPCILSVWSSHRQPVLLFWICGWLNARNGGLAIVMSVLRVYLPLRAGSC